MSTGDKSIMTIRKVADTEQKFEITQQKDEFGLAGDIDEILKQNQLVIELEDKVVVIPIQHIKCIDVAPATSKLPGYAIRNARLN